MEVNRATISSGSVGTFRSHTTLPVSSTTHTAVSFTETSRPTKSVIAIAPSSLLGARRPQFAHRKWKGCAPNIRHIQRRSRRDTPSFHPKRSLDLAGGSDLSVAKHPPKD